MEELRRRWVPETPEEYSVYLKGLSENRSPTEKVNTRETRKQLSAKERELILLKTDRRCHICGGEIESRWEADHVLPHSAGGMHSIDNYLPAHSVCNNYRWFYSPEEFQEIMRLGVWVRTQTQRMSSIGRMIADKFIRHEIARIKRRKSNA